MPTAHKKSGFLTRPPKPQNPFRHATRSARYAKRAPASIHTPRKIVYPMKIVGIKAQIRGKFSRTAPGRLMAQGVLSGTPGCLFLGYQSDMPKTCQQGHCCAAIACLLCACLAVAHAARLCQDTRSRRRLAVGIVLLCGCCLPAEDRNSARTVPKQASNIARKPDSACR